jgi:hypothetical protein
VRQRTDIEDEILLKRARRKAKYITPEIEKEARWETWLAYIRRNDNRLFDPGPHCGKEDRHWRAMEDNWRGKAIGCVAVMDPESSMFPYTIEEAIIVGVFSGIDRGYFGSVDFVVGHFSGIGSSTHRSPLNVGFVHVLGGSYQELVDTVYRDEDGEPWFPRDDYEEATHAEG